MKKRLISLLICLVMAVGFIPSGLFGITATAEEKLYKTENVEVPAGWDYIEASTAEELDEALNKHYWWENNNNPQSAFVRLTQDINITDSGLSKDAFTLMYVCLSTSLTIDFNGHKINGKISAINNQDNKCWNTLNIRIFYGCTKDLTLRFVDSVGGGGITLNAETYIDGPTTALCIHGDYFKDVYPGTADEDARYGEEGAKVIFDGGTYTLNTRNKKFTTTQYSLYKTFTDSSGQACWNDNWCPFTRSAVGLRGCKTVINNGHFTANNYIDEDDAGSVMGNRYVSALGLYNYYVVGNLRINGGDFDGSAYAIFCADGRQNYMPVLNGGTYKGGIMLCGESGTWWKKTKGVYDLDDDLKDIKVSKILMPGAIMYMDGKRIDADEKDLEDIGWPHTVSVLDAPEITALKAYDTDLLVGTDGNIYCRFNRTPDSLTVEEYITVIRNSKETSYWQEIEDAKYYITAGTYRVEIPAADKAKTTQIRIKVKFGDFELTSDEVSFTWSEVPDFAFTSQPVSQNVSVGETAVIKYDYNYRGNLLYDNLFYLKDGAYWVNAGKCSFNTSDDGQPYINITGPDIPDAETMTYQIVLEYKTPTSDGEKHIKVYSDEFKVTWDGNAYVADVEATGTIATGDTLNQNGPIKVAANEGIDTVYFIYDRDGDTLKDGTKATYGDYDCCLMITAADGYKFSPHSMLTYIGEECCPESVSDNGKTAWYYLPTIHVNCSHPSGVSSHSDLQHWKICSLCGAKYDVAEHDFNKSVSGSTVTYTCKDCGFTKTGKVAETRTKLRYVSVDMGTAIVGGTKPSSIPLDYATDIDNNKYYDAFTVTKIEWAKAGNTYVNEKQTVTLTLKANTNYYFSSISFPVAKGVQFLQTKYEVVDDTTFLATFTFTPYSDADIEVTLPQITVGKTYSEIIGETKFTLNGTAVEAFSVSIRENGGEAVMCNYSGASSLEADYLSKKVLEDSVYTFSASFNLGNYYGQSITVNNPSVGTVTDSYIDNTWRFADVEVTYETGVNGIYFASVTGIKEPESGKPITAGAPAGGNHYTVTGAWYDKKGTFACGQSYKVTVTLKADEGYHFSDKLKATTINGHNATVDSITTNKDTVQLSYTFTLPAHAYSNYKYDANYHWRECENGSCTEKQNYAAHTYKDGVCTVCGYSKNTGKLGDVNGDGEIKLADAMMAFKYVAKTGTLKTDEFTRADCNKDGYVKLADAMAIFKYVAKVTNTVEF